MGPVVKGFELSSALERRRKDEEEEDEELTT